MVVRHDHDDALDAQPGAASASFLGAAPPAGAPSGLLPAYPVLVPLEVEQVFPSLRLDKGSALLEENWVSGLARSLAPKACHTAPLPHTGPPLAWDLLQGLRVFIPT